MKMKGGSKFVIVGLGDKITALKSQLREILLEGVMVVPLLLAGRCPKVMKTKDKNALESIYVIYLFK